MKNAADPYEILKLENQLCFPLYVCAKEVVRSYKPFLDELDLTYTQYITMIALWEEGETNVKELGKKLFLDSGTLTPLLKKLESKGYLIRHRSDSDERNLVVSITKEGNALRDQALSVPARMAQCSSLDADDAKQLARILNKMMERLRAAL